MTLEKPGFAKWAVITFFFIYFLAIFLFSCALGTVPLELSDVFKALFFQNNENIASLLVWQIRAPRFFMACLAGGALAVAGQAMQILVRNPLADPYVMGSASGASLGVHLMVFFPFLSFLSGYYMVPLWGFLGAMLSTFFVLSLSRNNKNAAHILLLGVSVSMLLNGLLSLLTYWASGRPELRQLLFWAFGSLDKSDWNMVSYSAILVASGLFFMILAKDLWLYLLLGNEKGQSLGIKVDRSKKILFALASLLTASVVCFVGPVGFVGLIVPHITRQYLPLSHSGFWYTVFFAGAAFLSLADLVSRIAFAPQGLPIGLVTSLVGVPFFIYLLRNSKQYSFS